MTTLSYTTSWDTTPRPKINHFCGRKLALVTPSIVTYLRNVRIVALEAETFAMAQGIQAGIGCVPAYGDQATTVPKPVLARTLRKSGPAQREYSLLPVHERAVSNSTPHRRSRCRVLELLAHDKRRARLISHVLPRISYEAPPPEFELPKRQSMDSRGDELRTAQARVNLRKRREVKKPLGGHSATL